MVRVNSVRNGFRVLTGLDSEQGWITLLRGHKRNVILFGATVLMHCQFAGRPGRERWRPLELARHFAGKQNDIRR
jgi:hypothetical protein